MYPWYKEIENGFDYELPDDDKQAIQYLYGKLKTVFLFMYLFTVVKILNALNENGASFTRNGHKITYLQSLNRTYTFIRQINILVVDIYTVLQPVCFKLSF